MGTKKIRTTGNLAAEVGANTPGGISRRIYKATDCGASVSLYLADGRTLHGGADGLDALLGTEALKGVTVQSIVEGIDVTADGDLLPAPFTPAAFWRSVKWVEDEARRLWDETHGCHACGGEDENGYRAINPKCSACHGAGAIL